MPAFAITGTADFSNITNALEKLNNTMANIKPPAIKVQEPNFSNFFSACDKAEARTIKIKTEIDQSSMGAGLSSFLGKEKGNFANVGKEFGQSLTMGMQQQFGMAGGMATSLAGALGGVGIAAIAGVAGIGMLGAAATKAAMSWEDMKTSIGRTTGLDGQNLESLMNQLQSLRQDMGITADTARGLVESAGSIGVGQSKMAAGDVAGYKKEILDFAKSTAMLQGAWGMSADATATGIGKMGSVTLGAWNMQRKAANQAEMSWSEYAESVGGKVDVLANTMGSSEEEIVTAMKNSSAAVASYAPSEATYGKWLSLSSFLIDTGSSAGEAGTQIERLAKGAKQHGAELGAILGMDEAGFGAALKTDFVGTFQNIAAELASMPESERPDMIKLLGIEGSGAMDKMIADVQSGVNKLKTAIDLKPTDVSKGWDAVADNASKAFSRIGESFQVALEKVGGVILPVVTDLANGIADAMNVGIEVGSSAWGTGKALYTAAETAVSGASLESIDTAFLNALGIQTKEQMDAATKEGAKTGTEAGIKEGAEAGAEDAGKTIAEEFSKAQDDYIKSHSSGGYSGTLFTGGEVTTNKGQKITIGPMGSQYSSNYGDFGYKTSALSQSKLAGLEGYNLQRYARKSDVGGILQVTDASGNIIKSESYTSDSEFRDLSKRLREAVKPSILDLPKYMSSVDDQLSDEMASILDDGVVEFTEKETLRDYIKSLDELEAIYPAEFKAEGLDKLRQQLEDAANGIPVTLDTGQMETNFALWLAENAEAYSTIKTTTGITAYESDERAYFDAKQKLNDRELELLGYIDTAATSGNYQDIEVLPEVLSELGKTQPAVLGLTAVQNRLTTAQEAYKDQVTQTGDTFTVIDSSGKQVSGAHLRTSVAATILSGGLLSLANSISSLQGAVASAAASLSGLSGSSQRYGSIKQSNQAIGATNNFSGNFSGLSAAKTKQINWSGSEFTGKFNLPKLAEGGKVTSGGLAWIGEAGTEYVIPETSIKGLYPESAKVDKGSMKYLTGERFYEDYQYSVSPARGYQYSKWPNAPQVNVSGVVPSAWLSDEQSTGMDYISSEVRAAQLEAIKTGAGSVSPYWLRGESKQPDWWVDAATKLSPQYSANWAANKGGNMPQIVSDAKRSTISEDVALINDPRSDACIAFVKPSSSLRTDDAFYRAKGAANIDTDRTLLYDERTDSCIPMLSAPYLKTTDPFYLNSGSMNMAGESSSKLSQIEKNTAAIEKTSLQYSTNLKGVLHNGGIFGKPGSASFSVSGGSGALVTGLSEDGYVISYDPRTDTCEGLAFNPPSPYLKTTDPFYLGITSGDLLTQSYDEGYGWGGQHAQVLPGAENFNELQSAQDKALEALNKTEENTEKTAENTKQLSTDVGAIVNGGTTSGGLVIGGGGGGSSGIIGLANRGGLGAWGDVAGSWGGTSVSGAGGWVGTGSTQSGWGAAASDAAAGGGGSSWGSVQWAEGGIVNQPTWGVFGEAGREAFVPISDRAAGLRILPRVMQELGVRAFAGGGIVGKGGSLPIGGMSIGGITVINNSKSAVNEKKLAKEIMAQAEAKFYKSRRT